MTEAPAPRTLTVFGRVDCHLCEDMYRELAPMQQSLGFEITTVDIDADPTLVELYGDCVPVLMEGDTEICRHYLDKDELLNHLGVC